MSDVWRRRLATVAVGLVIGVGLSLLVFATGGTSFP